MKYLMLVCRDPEPESDESLVPSLDDWGAELDRREAWVMGDRLRPPEEARTVRVRGGVRRVTEGPFVESSEWICGFDVLECASMDEALELAAGHPMAHGGRIEVREFWPIEG